MRKFALYFLSSPRRVREKKRGRKKERERGRSWLRQTKDSNNKRKQTNNQQENDIQQICQGNQQHVPRKINTEVLYVKNTQQS